jgi:signal transduction histidine kinase
MIRIVAMPSLPEVLASHRNEVMQRWLDQVRGTLHPLSMPRMELVDHLPAFLDQMIAALQCENSDGGLDAAEDHGVQRLALGFSLDQVVREYGAMRTAILAVATDAGIQAAPRDYRVIFDCIINGIAGAVSEYSRQRNAETQRQATEHFAFVAHELRNPLSSAMLALSSLQANQELDPTDRTVASLHRGLHVMHDLIDHSLRLAQIGSAIELKPEPIQLRTLLEETESAVALDAEAKGIRIDVSLDGEHEIEVDTRLVRSALSNLVRNAVKFTHPGGTMQVRGKVSGGHATIEIEDSCGGLPPGDLEKVFSPFVQLDAGAGSGFGLGLAIARQAVDAHGGTLRIQNLPAKGCIFVLELPTAPSAS